MNKQTTNIFKWLLPGWIGVAFLMSVFAGCDSSSTSGTGGETVTGQVQAPSGQLAKAPMTYKHWFAALWPIADALAIDIIGWTEVANATLRVFAINDAGEPVGSVIATGTTNGSGAFSLTLPPGTVLASSLIVQASSDPGITGPVPVGTLNTLSAPVVGGVADINPATEAATRALVDRAEPLANFSASEVAGYLAGIEALVAAAALPPFADLAAAIGWVETTLAGQMTAALDNLSGSGGGTPGSLTGRWVSLYTCDTTAGDGFSGTDIIDITQAGNALSFTGANDEGPGTTPVFNMSGTGILNGNIVTWSATGPGFTESGTWEVTAADTMIKQSTYTNDPGIGGGGTCAGSIHREP